MSGFVFVPISEVLQNTKWDCAKFNVLVLNPALVT